MPIYAYRCEGCGFEKDALQKISDAPLVDCPQCVQPRLVKQLTAAGFALKGNGWYATDFKDSGKKPSTPAADAAKPASAPSDATSSTASGGAAPSPAGASASA